MFCCFFVCFAIKQKLPKYLLWFIAPVILHTILFIQFTAENNYAMMKYAPVIVIIAVLLMLQWKNVNTILYASFSFIVLQMFLYFYINNRHKDAVLNEPKNIAKEIIAKKCDTCFVFTKTSHYNYAAINYYSNRNFTFFYDQQSMQYVIDLYKIKKYLFIDSAFNVKIIYN